MEIMDHNDYDDGIITITGVVMEMINNPCEYPPVLKHGNGTFPLLNGGFHGKSIYKWGSFHGRV